jgi:plastocyanin domain-containing protein
MKSVSIYFFFTFIIGMSQHTSAATTDITIKIEKGHFFPSSITIPWDTKVKLTIENHDDTPEEFDSHDLNREVLIKGNSKASIYIGPLPKGRYAFEGEFSPETAQGEIIVK